MARGDILSRGRKKRKEKPVIAIITEGRETEPLYFRHFNSREKSIRVLVIENKASGADTDLKSLLLKAASYKAQNLLSPKKGDAVWIVADGDVDYTTPGAPEAKNRALSEARKQAKSHEIQLAISNPCFELWYYLHFEYSTGFLKDYEAVKSKLTHLPEYEKNQDVFERIAVHTDDAIQRAKRLEQYHLDNGEALPLSLDANPFTEVYRLVEQIK